MTTNVKNQQEDQNKTAGKEWVVKLSPIFATLVPSSSQDTDIIGNHEHYVDITKFREIELELQQAKNKLKEAKNKLKEAELIKIDLIQNIGHSINIPCTGIFTRIVVLYEYEQNPEMKEYLATIMNCAKALLDYSNDLIDFLQHHAGLASTVLKPFDPKKLVKQSIAKAEPAASHKGLRLVPNIHYEMPDVIVGDSYRLQAILDQLISNSIQFTEEGMVVITANLFPARSFEDANDFTNNTQIQDDRKRILQLMVHDTGIGIHQEKQQYICEEFVKFNSALQCKGLGLGLMFVRQLINEMHGEIALSSEEGKTTTVECKVPVKLPAIDDITCDD